MNRFQSQGLPGVFYTFHLLVVLKYNLLNPLDLDAGLFWDWGRLATKDLKNLGFTQTGLQLAISYFGFLEFCCIAHSLVKLVY